MKFVSVAIFGAFLCATVASAGLLISQLRTSTVLVNVAERLSVYRDHKECIEKVFNDVYGKSDVAALWNSVVMKVETILIDWERAKTITNEFEALKYKSILLSNAFNALSIEVPALISDAKWDLVNEVRKEVSSQCLEKFGPYELLDDSDYLALWKSLSVLSAYVLNMLEDLAGNSGLYSWGEYQIKLQYQFEKLNECTNGIEGDVDICTIREGIAFFQLATEFGRMAFNEPEVSSLFTESS